MLNINDVRLAAASILPGYDVSEAYVYGSFARGDQHEKSDVDLRLLCGGGMTFSQLLDIQEALEGRLGCACDIATAPLDQMRASFRKRVKAEEVLIYAA